MDKYLRKRYLIMKFRTITKKELIWLLVSVITLGFCLSFLDRVALGIEPFTMFNLSISKKLHMSLGNWQVLLNCLFFIPVLLYARDQIGLGTFANMILVGYSFDFFSWINHKLIPDPVYEPLYAKILIMIPILAIFIFAVSVYMSIQQGTAPYDAIPYILHRKIAKVPFKIIRITWDFSFCMLGVLLGAKPGIVTFIIVFALGPTISYTSEHLISKLLNK